ncbi:hypothetical protein ZEAMMB73_Zm00001d043254 [Zea mays]|uniref:Uncharacterized protein n=1 Tax=Zea mays TaxID=4577 RepID=A0A1D6N9S1_MAIZE|nr:hypothetical protein ZEAMMB73_Zm00001d043254 [Zea mays]
MASSSPQQHTRWQQLLIDNLVGYDTIPTNSLVISPGHGYLYNFEMKELNGLSYGHETPEGPTKFGASLEDGATIFKSC